MRRSGLFLIELVLALLFFSITSAVCMQIFGASAVMTRKKANRDAAVDASVCAAECLKAAGGDLEKTAELLGNGAVCENGILTQPCGEALTITVSVSDVNDAAVFCTADVTDEKGDIVHTMEIAALKQAGGVS